MMLAKLDLNEAIQVGPWRIARKHLLFVILFSLSIIVFGIIILLSHVFDNEESEEEGEENENENENEENEEEEGKRWGNFRQKFSSGDWVVVAIMILAGLMSVGATMICFMVRKDTPRRLNSSVHRNASIYSVQFNNGTSKVPISDNSSYSVPQPLPLWQGHVQLPPRTSASQDPVNLNQQAQNKPIQITVSNIPRASKPKNTSTSSPSAPQIEGESPPPYSP